MPQVLFPTQSEKPEIAEDDFQRSRLHSLDAFRGFIMLMMASAGFGLVQLGRRFPDTAWETIGNQFQHVEWIGCSLWDLIQPAFMFMVGLSLAYSYGKRKENGESWGRMFRHAVSRAILLTLLGVFLQSSSKPETNWLFTNVLSQIGLGYIFVFLLWEKSRVAQILSALILLIGYWLAFYYHVYPEPGITLAELKLTPDDLLPGGIEPWTIHLNFAATFDRWYLNLFPRPEPWVIHPGGYQTLNFVPAIATMLAGLAIGEFLRDEKTTPDVKLKRLLLAGVPLLALGVAAGVTVCPIVKRIWTPSWVLYSTGWVIWMLAFFYGIIDVWGKKGWAFPLKVVGMNSIAIYLMYQLMTPWILKMLKTHIGADIFQGDFGPMQQRCTILFVLWLMCLYLYRRKIFFRI